MLKTNEAVVYTGTLATVPSTVSMASARSTPGKPREDGPSVLSSPWLSKAIAGTGAGVVATALCSPLDVAKTRIQVQSTAAAQGRYSGVIQALLTIYREEGVRGWYFARVLSRRKRST